MDHDRILVEITIRRRYAQMGPTMQSIWRWGRELLRVAVTIALMSVLVDALEGGLALAAAAGTAWLWIEPWLHRESPGRSRVLMTDGGIYIMEDGIFCPWEDVGFHTVQGDVLVFEPTGEAAGSGPFRKRRRRIPLGRGTRARVKELFAERAGARRPGEG